jgi:hypothetical protein
MDEKISRLSQAELLSVLQTLAEFTPLTKALFNSVIERGDDKVIEDCVFAEIRQLGIWFDSSPEFDVWASTLVSEKIYRIFYITEHLKRHHKYAVIGRIYREILRMMIHFISNSIDLDDEVENYLTYIFEEMSEWDQEDINPSDLETLNHLFNDTGLFKTLDDFGFGERLQVAILAWCR